MNRRDLSIAACLFVAACGSAPDGTAAGSQPATYADMTFEQRALFMNDVVLPQMTQTFVAFDPKFAKMSCATCHGEGMLDGSYAMPSARIPKLPASEEAFYEYLKDPEHARWSQFMLDKVWPEMATLLKVPMFDPATHADGFSCSNCHTVESVGH
ncbi:MAG TPA: hypothetical protein VK550_15215 [Polyangiaceae bacterium]|nr:hypothetical protein [Polyangiaceae bacterium]